MAQDMTAILATPEPTPPSDRAVARWYDDDGNELETPVYDTVPVWAGWCPETGDPVLYRQRDPLDPKAWVWLVRSVVVSPSQKRISIKGQRGSYSTPYASRYGATPAPETRIWFGSPVSGSGADNYQYFAFPWEKEKYEDDRVVSDEFFAACQKSANEQARMEREVELARGFTVRLAERLQNPRRSSDGAAYAVLLDYPDGISAEDVKFLALLFDRALEDRETLDRQIRDAINAVSPDRHFNHSDRVQRAIAEVLPPVEETEDA